MSDLLNFNKMDAEEIINFLLGNRGVPFNPHTIIVDQEKAREVCEKSFQEVNQSLIEIYNFILVHRRAFERLKILKLLFICDIEYKEDNSNGALKDLVEHCLKFSKRIVGNVKNIESNLKYINHHLDKIT